MGLSQNGQLFVNFTECNQADEHARGRNVTNATVTSEDSFGAMQYTIAVVVLYGIAMLGVFGLGQFKRRKRRHDNMDVETSVFLKNYDKLRRNMEQQSRVGAVSALLTQLHNGPVSDETFARDRPSTASLAFLPITLSEIQSDVNSVSRTDVGNATASCDDSFTDIYASTNSPSGVQENRSYQRQEVRVTLLGSSRRNFSSCKHCLETHGVNVSRQECWRRSSAAWAKIVDDESSGTDDENTRQFDKKEFQTLNI